MATSNAYTFSDTPVDQLMAEAFEQCGFVSDTVSGLQIVSASRSLDLMFSEWVNKGLNLWTVEKNMASVVPGQSYYNLPPATIDIAELTLANPIRQLGGTPSASSGNAANAFDGNPATACTQTAPNGWIAYDYGIGNQFPIEHVGVQSNQSLSYTLSIEYSFDNITWFQVLTPSLQSYIAGQIVWFVVPIAISARYWRIIETGGATLDIQELYFSVPGQSRILSRLSRSEYMSLPNKGVIASATTYWVNRTVTPVLILWPVPDTSYQTMIFTRRRYIQDVGAYINQLDAPQRFLDAVTSGLAARLALKFAPDKYEMLAGLASAAYDLSASEDRERVPVHFEIDDDVPYYGMGL